MRTESRISSQPTTRLRVAQALVLLALIAALVGALGPAERVRTTYSWPPETLPAESPHRVWYTPLVLARHRPESISASVPCTPPPALPGVERPLTVLATARYPVGTEALALRRRGDEVVVRIGNTILTRLDLVRTRAATASCSYELRLGSGRWSLEGGPEQHALGGELETMPRVTGIFSELDLRRTPLRRSASPPPCIPRRRSHGRWLPG